MKLLIGAGAVIATFCILALAVLLTGQFQGGLDRLGDKGMFELAFALLLVSSACLSAMGVMRYRRN